MPDLSTTYLGLTLRNPLVASASPLAEHLDELRRLEEAGIGAVVMHSLFEEEVIREEHEADPLLESVMARTTLVAPHDGTKHAEVGQARRLRRVRFAGLRAAARAAVFMLKVYPMLPSRPLDWVTPAPVVERLRYPTSRGPVEGELYRPATGGPHPGIVVCLGVVPFGVDHPQVPRLGAALARSGFAALLYWSPAMRAERLDPADIADIASAYDTLLAHPRIDAGRSGLLGTCVGGAFALMAAADPRIRDRVAFLSAYAPYASMWTLARDIASASCERDGARRPWAVDPLTRAVFVQSLTALLDDDEQDDLRAAWAGADSDGADRRRSNDRRSLSDEGRAIDALLAGPTAAEATALLRGLPAGTRSQLDALSPLRYLDGVRAAPIVLLHDRDDVVIPVGESRCLRAALRGRAGAHYTEFTVFKHLDPTKGNPAPLRLARELVRCYLSLLPIFRRAQAA